jgi:hypothetical protein
MAASRTSLALAACCLLAISWCLVAETAPSLPAPRTRTPKHDGDEEYMRLRIAQQRYGYRIKKTYINHLEGSAKCPFRVLRARGFTRVMCDFTGCYNQKRGPCLSDCQQAYMPTTDLLPRKSKTRHRVYEEAEVACVYTPTQSNHSIQTAHPGPYV